MFDVRILVSVFDSEMLSPLQVVFYFSTDQPTVPYGTKRSNVSHVQHRHS